MLTDGPCNSPGSCDFEQGLCFYVNAVDDEFDWLIGSGLTSQSEGPDDDHTSGTAYGTSFAFSTRVIYLNPYPLSQLPILISCYFLL